MPRCPGAAIPPGNPSSLYQSYIRLISRHATLNHSQAAQMTPRGEPVQLRGGAPASSTCDGADTATSRAAMGSFDGNSRQVEGMASCV